MRHTNNKMRIYDYTVIFKGGYDVIVPSMFDMVARSTSTKDENSLPS